MRNIKKWTWQTWFIVVGAVAVVSPQAWEIYRSRIEFQARLALPTTGDLFTATYVDLARDENRHLVVYTDAHALEEFTGRFKVTLRNLDTGRHEWTPEWSDRITYRANPDGTRYRQPETLQWWSGYDEFVEPPQANWVMETCWQAQWDDPVLGTVDLAPFCMTSIIKTPGEQTIINEVSE